MARHQESERLYVVSHRDKHDNKFFTYSDISLLGSNMADAWVKFIKLCGKDRQHWNRLGYIAVPVTLTVRFKK
jgi:hypothetical protein